MNESTTLTNVLTKGPLYEIRKAPASELDCVVEKVRLQGARWSLYNL